MVFYNVQILSAEDSMAKGCVPYPNSSQVAETSPVCISRKRFNGHKIIYTHLSSSAPVVSYAAKNMRNC